MISEVKADFKKRLDEKIAGLREHAGKGISDQSEYWKLVGQIGGLQMSMDMLIEVYSKYIDEEDLEDDE